MKKKNPTYYRIIIVFSIAFLCAIIYSAINYTSLMQDAKSKMFDKNYELVTRAYDKHDYDLSKDQLNSAIDAMTVIETNMDSSSHLQINQSIGELQLLQSTIGSDLITSDVLKVILSRSLRTLSYGEIRLAREEILENNVDEGISCLNRAKNHLLTSLTYIKPIKQEDNKKIIGQIESLTNSLKKDENYAEKLEMLSLNSKKLLIGRN
mgnify:CR=1 FL=1